MLPESVVPNTTNEGGNYGTKALDAPASPMAAEPSPTGAGGVPNSTDDGRCDALAVVKAQLAAKEREVVETMAKVDDLTARLAGLDETLEALRKEKDQKLANVVAEKDKRIDELEAALALSDTRDGADRDAMPDSYVQPSAAPGVGTYQKDHTAAAEPTSNVGGAAFRDGADRDAMPDSYVRPSAAPGVGTYAPQPAASYESGAVNATYASATDRFGPDMTSHVRPSEAPGAKYGKDHALPEETDVKGVIKIQAAVRRRQSRGIFATMEKRAAELPDSTYAPTPFGGKLAKKKQAGFHKDIRARFAASGESGGVPGTASSSSSDSLLLPVGRVAAAPGSAERGASKRWLGSG